MISIDEHSPSDPSSSHDLKSSDNTDLKSSDASADLDDTYNPLPNISIRDYVFGLRNKDIACNWPFSPTSLQLCLKHGVKNLLPPFESLDSLRNNTPLTRCSLENRLTEDEIINNLDGKPMCDQIRAASLNSSGSKKDKESQFRDQETLARTRSKEKPSQKIQSTSRDKKSGRVMKLKLKSAVERVEKSQFHHQEYLGHTKSKEKPPLQKNENVSSRTKKSRFVMKLNSGVERVEEVVPNCVIVSETMASKVCPVCKIFSSSSNTTLNAHIDQCLTGEGTLKWTENPKILVKHKVKPRKMRSMVDIYKTAPHCTVEELDERNGTSWATNSCFPDQEFQFQGEEKEEDDKEEEDEEEEEVRTTKIIPNVADNEGDVYIDTNGKKVRILSVPKTILSDNNSARKLVKRVKGGKMIMAKKKSNIFKKKHQHKQLKISPDARKLCSSKPQAVSGPIAESCSEDERGKEFIRPSWAWSKRASLLKKSHGTNQKVENFSGKNRRADLQCRETKDLGVESEKTSSGCDFKIRRSSSHNNSSSLQSRKKLRTSSPLIKQPLNEFRKEGTRIHLDEDEDDDDDNDDFDDDDYDTYDDDAGPSQHSDGGDIRPKGSKFASLCKNLSFPAAKFSFKRKISAVENLIEDLDDRLSQNSSKDQSRMKEHAATRTNASKTSNNESSVGIRTVNKDEVCDVESIRNETLLSNVDQVRVSSFMGLSMSFDPEFSKCIDLYEDQICSTNRAPNDVEQHENYVQVVDPIPIPGPPGSFLPASPCEELGEMVATSVRSSENQNLKDTMDQDSTSNSPVSTISYSRSTSVQDDTYKKPFFNGDTGFTDKGPSQNSLKNDQPCCCSRKEAALNYQESFNSRKQPIESSITSSRGLNFESEMFPLRNYPNSPAPALVASPSKPVLRLMGKNLTVVKTDEDQDVSLSSQQFRTPQSSQQNPQPVAFSHYQNGFDSQHFNAHPPINMRSPADLGPINGGFVTYMNPYDGGGSYMGPMISQARSYHGHDAIDFQAVSGRNVYNNVPSGSQPIKEIIVLDDSPENEADNSLGNEFVKRNQEQMNPLYSMPSQRSLHLYGSGGSTVFHGVGFRTFENGDPGRWNIGSSSASPSVSHMRTSTTFYPPSYP
nr:hypothetical protein [Tanacetum cinerariifolium]